MASCAGREQRESGGLHADAAGADPVVPDAALGVHPPAGIPSSQRVFLAGAGGSCRAPAACAVLVRVLHRQLGAGLDHARFLLVCLRA